MSTSYPDTHALELFISRLTPEQETLVLLREIRDLLKVYTAAREAIKADQAPNDGSLEDVLTNITPAETPLLKSISKKAKR